MNNKSIIAKVMSKLAKTELGISYEEACKMWSSEAEKLSKDFDNVGNPPKNIEDYDSWRDKYKEVKKEMLALDKVLDSHIKSVKKYAKPQVEISKGVWNSMISEWEVKKEELIEKLEKIGPPPQNINDFSKWKKQYDLISLNLEVLEEDADDLVKRKDLKVKSAGGYDIAWVHVLDMVGDRCTPKDIMELYKRGQRYSDLRISMYSVDSKRYIVFYKGAEADLEDITETLNEYLKEEGYKVINKLAKITHPGFTPEVIQEARDWISECSWNDLDADEIDDLSDEEVLKGVKKHYSGGLDGFLRDGDHKKVG